VNLPLSLLAAAERQPDAEALPGITYAELRERAARIAGGLGLKPGERLATVIDNRVETALLFWAAQWCGAVFVPLSWRASQADLDYCIKDCDARIVLREGSPLPDGPEHPGALDLDEREPSVMLYTSGTTGRPKGVPRSHRADRTAGLLQALQHGYRFGDRTLGVMPLYHTMGIHSLIAMHLIGGYFVSQARWDEEEALRLIQEERITSLFLAPTLFYDLVHHPRLADYDVSSVETLVYAGASMTGALVERCVEVFRPRLFVNYYGSTEIYTFSFHRDQAAKPGCAGRPSLGVRLRLAENGEILCHMSSDVAFTGYWKRPDAEAKAIREGWYHTGDVGRLDEDGELWILGRVDDMIISAGENIHPIEVEDVLTRHPKVAEVAVVGAQDERLGQRVLAIVVPEGEVTAEELDAFCLASGILARFKRPRQYRFVESLPKNPSGKILRRLLRENEVAAT
jgi:2-furoate---CoA ligase